MFLVHRVANKGMESAEYSAFYALLRLFVWLGIPSAGLQMVFAKQAAAAHTEEKKQELSATFRGVLQATFVLWLVVGLLGMVLNKQILSLLQMKDAGALYMTILLVLPTLWLPVFKGVLQGKHNFAWMGWLQIIEGIGRFATIAIIVILFHGQATGGILACLIGQGAAFFLGLWLIRDVWLGLRAKFDWSSWLAHVIPLTLGLGTILFVTSADALFVKSIFDQEVCRIYMNANLIGFAIMQFVAPITSVMFPKIVQSMARSEKSDALQLTVGITFLVSACGAAACTIMPTLPLRIIFHTPESLLAAPLVPWFAWALVPLTLANVLLTNLLACQRYTAILWLLVVAAAFPAALGWLSPTLLQMKQMDAFRLVVQILGLESLLLAGVAAWFSWGKKS